MRTTLEIDDDILAAAKEAALGKKSTAGRVISDWARQALTQVSTQTHDNEPVCGFRPFVPSDQIVTNSLVEKLREDGPY